MRQVVLILAAIAAACSPGVDDAGYDAPVPARQATQSLDAGDDSGTVDDSGPADELPARDAILAAFRFDSVGSIDSELGENLTLELRPGPDGSDPIVSPVNGGVLLERGGYYLDTVPEQVFLALVDPDGFAMEAWVRPGNLSQNGPARIFTLSENSSLRNLTMGQERDLWSLRMRWDNDDLDPVSNGQILNGTPSLRPVHQVTTELVHLVVTYDGNFATLWIDGQSALSAARPDGLANWSPTYGLAVANEFEDDRQWQGELYSFTIYDRALRPDEVGELHSAGRLGGER